MKRKKQILTLVIAAAMVLQASIVVFAAVNHDTPSSSMASIQAPAPNQETKQSVAPAVVSPAVLEKIQTDDSGNGDHEGQLYQTMLASFEVYPDIQKELDKLILEGYSPNDVMTGYEYLYHNFGSVADLQAFLKGRSEGKSWRTIFSDYTRNQSEFVPRTFDSQYLEKLMSNPALSADDIMIADKLSFATGKPFEDLMNARLEAKHWRSVTASFGILFSADSLPRVSINEQKMKEFLQTSGLTERQITEAFVTAFKIGKGPEYAVDKMKQGYSIDDLFAEGYEEKYR